MIVIAGKATIQSSQRQEALQKAQHMSKLSEAEAGCYCYRFYVEPADPDTFFIFEHWDNAKALERHFQSAHFQAFGAYLQTVLARPLDIKRYEVTSVGPLA